MTMASDPDGLRDMFATTSQSSHATTTKRRTLRPICDRGDRVIRDLFLVYFTISAERQTSAAPFF